MDSVTETPNGKQPSDGEGLVCLCGGCVVSFYLAWLWLVCPLRYQQLLLTTVKVLHPLWCPGRTLYLFSVRSAVIQHEKALNPKLIQMPKKNNLLTYQENNIWLSSDM